MAARLAGAAVLVLLAACPRPRPSLEQARERMERGEAAEVCGALERLVRGGEGPRDRRLDAVRTWIDCLARTGELRRVDKVLKALPGSVLRLYGEALAAVARSPAGLPRALRLLARAAGRWPDESELHYRQGVLLLADQQPGAALPHLRRAARLRDTAATAVAMAHALLDLGQLDQALAQVRRVVELQPDKRDLRRGRALIQRVARRTRTVPRGVRKEYREALDLLRRRDLAGQCIRKVEGILLDHPRLAAAYTVLGLAHLRLGNAAEAVVALRRALALNPVDATNPLYLAVIYQKRGQSTQSIKYFRRALDLDPFLVRAARELGQLLLREGRGREAAEVLERVLVLDPESESARRLAGRAYLAAGALRRAERYFAELARSSPDDFELNLRLGQLLLKRYRAEGKPRLLDRAAEHISRASKVRPEDGEVEELQLQLRLARQGK